MQLDSSLLNSMYSPFPKKCITYYVQYVYLYITDTMSVACLYFIALQASFLYCVVLLFQEILGSGGRVGQSVGLHWRPDGAGWVRIPLWTTSLRNFGNSLYPALSVPFGGDTKAAGPFYLVSMPGEVKYPTSQHWNV